MHSATSLPSVHSFFSSPGHLNSYSSFLSFSFSFPFSLSFSLLSYFPSGPLLSSGCSLFLYVFIAIYFFSFFSSVRAAPPSGLPYGQGLSLFAVNANGLHDVMKTNAIKQHVSASRPHVWIVNETKSRSPVASRVFVPGYNTYESTALPTAPHTSKWGVIAAVRRDLHSQRIPTPDGLAGRVIILDITIPTTSHRGFIFRVIALYAPWDPGGSQPTPQQFWNMILPLCQAAPSRAWCLMGDCNLTLHSIETSGSGPHPNRAHYMDFLQRSDGHDLWLTREDRSVLTHYTYSRGSSRSILDRVAHSHSGVISGSIDIAPLFVGATDHRPISATLMLSHTGLGNALFPALPTNNQPHRFRYPSSNSRAALATFAASVDTMINEQHLTQTHVHNDDSFDSLYDSLSRILLSAASSFQMPFARNPSPRLRNQTIRLLVRENRRVGRLIYAVKTGPLALARLQAHNPWVPPYLTAFHSRPHISHNTHPPSGQQSLLSFLSRIRRSLNKVRYHEEHLKATATLTRQATGRINRVLLGGSSNILYPPLLSSSPPLTLTDPTAPSQLLTGPNEIKDAMVSYFSNLYHHSDAPPLNAPKPWLSTPSVLSIREHTLTNSFPWPQQLSLPSLCALLRKGNSCPAPGPNRWEKWFIKALSDTALSLVLQLLNYEITHSHFPDSVKPSSVSTIYKRGSPFDLSNYRGVCCSNFLLSTPFTWLNHCLSPYISRLRILPPGQVATQAGLQGHDLTSLFTQIESWARRHSIPLYALRRDQQKGFDRLSPQGFYDAIHAYGLSEQLIQLDISAQTNVPYSFKTAYGLTDPLLISGVTKQGGPLSPLKSTLITSLGHHWLNDIALNNSGALVLSTHQARVSFPHVPTDHLHLPITMVEAMDDSTIFATSASFLHTLVLSAECFQAAYGWLTAWSKSLLLLINMPDAPSVASMPSVDPDNMLFDHILMHDVSVVTDHIEFLHVATNDPR